jgi:hypothetical protein
MATRTPGRAVAPPPSTNGSRKRPTATGAGSLGTTKRSVPMALVGVAAVVLGALLALALYTSVDRRQAVLAVRRPVAAGQVIAPEDLRQVRVSTADGITPVPVSRSATVVGKSAAVALVPGTLITSDHVGAPSSLQAGQAIVGVALKAGQAPAALPPGTRVQVVTTVKGGGGTDQARPVVLTSSAVVAPAAAANGAQAKPTTSAITVVSLIVPANEAPAVAAAAADGQVSLVALHAS